MVAFLRSVFLCLKCVFFSRTNLVNFRWFPYVRCHPVPDTAPERRNAMLRAECRWSSVPVPFPRRTPFVELPLGATEDEPGVPTLVEFAGDGHPLAGVVFCFFLIPNNLCMEDVPTLTPTTSEKHSTDLQCRQQFNIQLHGL